MSGNHVITYKANGDQEVKLSPGIVRNYLVSGNPDAVSDQEVTMFLQLCRYQHLNPFLREAYLIKYGSEPATIVTGRDVFTKRAAKNDQFDGMESGLYVVDENGAVQSRSGSFKLPSETIVGAWAKVHRKDWSIPVEVSVSLEEYQGKKKDGTVTKQWATKPGTMLTKVAETQALRKAFPDDFGGLYDAAEVHQGEQDLPTEPVEPRDVSPEQDEPSPFEKRRSEIVGEINQWEREGKIDLEQMKAAVEYVHGAKNSKQLEKAYEKLQERITENQAEEPKEDEGQQELSENDELP